MHAKHIAAITFIFITQLFSSNTLAENKIDAMRFEISLNKHDAHNVSRSYLIVSSERPAIHTVSDSKGYISLCGKGQGGSGIKTDYVNTEIRFQLARLNKLIDSSVELSWDISMLEKFNDVQMQDCIQQTPVVARNSGKSKINILAGVAERVAVINIGQESYDIVVKRTY